MTNKYEEVGRITFEEIKENPLMLHGIGEPFDFKMVCEQTGDHVFYKIKENPLQKN